jgi:hypothetical protein
MPVAVIGGWTGAHAGEIMRQPRSWRKVAPLLLAAVAFPFLTGMIDLYLRLTIP